MNLGFRVVVLQFCLKASTSLHDKVFRKLLTAPMRFFDVTPCGQILNRFSKDIDEGKYIPAFYWPVNLNAFYCTIIWSPDFYYYKSFFPTYFRFTQVILDEEKYSYVCLSMVNISSGFMTNTYLTFINFLCCSNFVFPCSVEFSQFACI